MPKVLTDMTVQKLPPGLHFDAKMPSFGIRVGKTRKTWIVVKGPNRTKVALGHYPAISLQDARKKAHHAFAAPDVRNASITFPEALAAFLAQDKWRFHSKRVLASSLKHFPWTGQLTKITHEQVIEALDAIEGRSARAHALKDIRTFFNWTIPRYLAASPATGIKMPNQPSRDRVLSDDELKRVWIAAEQLGQFGVIVRLLILTGQRRGEIGSLKWEWIKDRSITLPASATKNGREHSVPMTEYALSTFQPCRNTALSKFVFPARSSSTTSGISARSESPFNTWSKTHSNILKLSGTSGWTLHDLRRTFASNQARLGTPIHIIEKLLNHVSGSLAGVAGIYNRYSYFEEMAVAMQRHEDFVLSLARQ